MRTLVEKLFGVDLTGWNAEGRWRVEWSAMPEGGDALFWGALLLVGVVLGVGWLYRKDAGGLATRARWALVALRVVVAVAIALVLLEPVLVVERVERVPSHLVVLRDVSASMELRDRYPAHRLEAMASSTRRSSSSAETLVSAAARRVAHRESILAGLPPWLGNVWNVPTRRGSPSAWGKPAKAA